MAWKTKTVHVLTLMGVIACSTGLADSAPNDRESALALVEDFISIANSGDVAASSAFFDDANGTIEANYYGAEGDEAFLTYTESDGLKWLANRVAAHALREDPHCSARAPIDSVVEVECAYESAYVVRAAVGAPTLQTSSVFSVRDGRILRFEENVIASGPNVGHGYIGWLAGRNPWDASVAGLERWQSIDQAVASGEAEARHADEYADFLKKNDCEITGECPSR